MSENKKEHHQKAGRTGGHVDAVVSVRGDYFKKDHGKAMWDLLPLDSVRQIVEVLTFGAKKYAPEQWKNVPHARGRYFSAMMRHIESWYSGEKIDKESGLHHLAHAGCCLLFLIWIDCHR